MQPAILHRRAPYPPVGALMAPREMTLLFLSKSLAKAFPQKELLACVVEATGSCMRLVPLRCLRLRGWARRREREKSSAKERQR